MIGLTPPLEGGSERAIYELSSRIKDCEVLTQKESICKNKIEVGIMKKYGNFIKNISFMISVWIYSMSLIFCLKKKYEVIHIHENLLYFLAPVLRLRYKVVISVHGIKGFKYYDNKLFWIFFRTALSFSNQLIAVSLEDKNLLEKYFKKVEYIPNGVDLSIYNKINPKVENKIVFIGRIHEQKGIIYLLKAFDKIKDKIPNFKLEIIGDINDYAKNLQKEFADKRIIWRGFIKNREEIVKSLKSSYCIVLPSLWEGLPLTLFEALASERPVLVSDIPVFRSIIKEEFVFFKVQDSKSLSSKIEEIIKERELSNKIGRDDLIISKEYDWNNIVKKTEKVYGELMK